MSANHFECFYQENRLAFIFTYNESTDSNHNDTTSGSGLGIDGSNLVADLVEAQGLFNRSVIRYFRFDPTTGD